MKFFLPIVLFPLAISLELLFAQSISSPNISASDPRLEEVLEKIRLLDKKYSSDVLIKKYLEDLKALEPEVAKAGNLNHVVQVREEHKAWASGAPTKPFDPKDKSVVLDLRKLRYYFDRDRDIEGLAEREGDEAKRQQLSEQLLVLEASLTKEAKIDDALIARKARVALNDSSRVSKRASLPERWFGHYVCSRPKILSRMAKHANCVFDCGWQEYGDELIRIARESKTHVILVFQTDMLGLVKDVGFDLARKNPDVVTAMCWSSPYYAGKRPSDLASFGKELKKSVPGIQFWGSFVESPRGRVQTQSVPPEVDVIVVAEFYDTTPQLVEKKSDKVLPGWVEKSKGRPVILYWSAFSSKEPGLVASCEIETMDACEAVATKYGLSGLILGHYGERFEHRGIERRGSLEKRIREIASRVLQPDNHSE